MNKEQRFFSRIQVPVFCHLKHPMLLNFNQVLDLTPNKTELFLFCRLLSKELGGRTGGFSRRGRNYS